MSDDGDQAAPRPRRSIRRPTTMSGDVPLLHRALDAVIDRFGDAEHEEEVAAARAEFEDRRGRVFEDEPMWEEWTLAFLEWMVVERPWQGGPPPVVLARGAAEGQQRAALAAWQTSQRALAEVVELQPGQVTLIDRIGGAAFVVHEERALHGVQPGDMVEVRLIGFEGAVRFGRTFVYHPHEARDVVAAHARTLTARGMSRVDVLDALAALRVKVERYRHVDPIRVYEAGPDAARPAE